ncbi:response regulator [Glaciecola sp. SC05]|uniref:response regulator n=1 Tax=Glaciecola sp. SC05 TaxID=1987355 RepID=UPI003529948C
MRILNDACGIVAFMLILIYSLLVHYNASATAANYESVGNPLTKIYSAKEHGGHNQNWTSIQDEDGLIYVGHTQGISQWDGKQWTNLLTPQSTPVRSITKFKGDLYFGTTDDIFKLQVNRSGALAKNSIINPQLNNMQNFGEVWSSIANTDGVLFVTAEHTFFYDGERMHSVSEALSSKHNAFVIDNAFYYKTRNLPFIYKLSTSKQAEKVSFSQVQLPVKLPENARVMEILTSKDNKLTIFTEQHGVFQMDNDRLIQLRAPEDFAADIRLYDAILSSDGLYYVSSTFNGLFILDGNLNIIRQYTEDDGISMNTVFSVNEDLQGNIWLTGIPNVVSFRPPHLISQFKAGNTSTEILRFKNTSFGIFAAGNGIYKLSNNVNSVRPPYFMSLSSNINNSIDLVEFDDTLIRSGYGGVFELKFNPDQSALLEENLLINTVQGRLVQYNPETQSFLVSATDGAFSMQKENGQYRYKNFSTELNNLISLYRDKHDTLWLGTATSQLFALHDISDFGINAPIQRFTRNDGLGLGPVEIFNINDEAIFSSAGKLFRFSENTIQAAELPMFNENWLSDSQLIDKIIQTPATATTPERLWYRKNGQSGYFEHGSDSDKWTEFTHIFDAIPDGGFNDLFVDSDDILWFVRDKAEMYRVDMAQIGRLPAMAPLNVRKIESNNQLIDFKVAPGSRVELLPQQKNLRFSYASTDSSSPKPIEYRTRLADGENANWSNWSQETYRDFTQLVPNHYRLQVQAKDAWGRTTETYLDIAVIAPWYLTKTAYAIYAFISIMLILGFAWIVQNWRTAALESANKALELKVQERTKEVNEKVEQLRQQQILKDRFFSNVSHEFRTPLTLTIGPLETLITEHQSELSQAVKHLAKTALSNASKMLALVGQVLDLNRLEAGKLTLRIAQYDMAELLRNIGDRFENWAKQNGQVIQTVGCDEPLLLWFDIDQFDKCVSNLLSNAIKYSGHGSKIEMQLINKGSNAEIIVRDNGVGISEDAKLKVFERFYQDKTSENVSTPGTGIGLSLVKELMEIHFGEARLADTSDRGCCFVLTLKSGNQHFAAEQIIEPIEFTQTALLDNDKPDATNIIQPAVGKIGGFKEDEDVTTLLIVDDNQELLNFISLRLSGSFRIIQAVNGQEGYNKACSDLPDLIISDVNMPIMTGLELATKIKTTPETKTIPIILLTAKATKREVVEGFSVGADDYLTKPFDTSELIMRVNAQINARKLVRDDQRSKLPRSSDKAKPSTFKSKLEYIVAKQISEPSFNVEQLSASLHMSRDTLIRRCKKECGETPLNIIVQARISLADKLLSANEMSISEVAYACGFESLAYFSKSYKKHRGLSPSDVTTN